MTPAARERMQVTAPMLFISAAAWTWLVLNPSGAVLASHCLTGVLGAAPSGALLNRLLSPASLPSFVLGWTLMIAAMMVPLLIPSVRHIRDRSFVRRRVRAIALFVAGYAAIWTAAGLVLLILAQGLRRAISDWRAIIVFELCLVLLWQVSPAKQRSLNRGHAHPALAAFGSAADFDALRFGYTHGIWCVASCWALMLLTLMVMRGHLAVMAAITLWLLAERLENPMPARWRWRGPGKAARIAVAGLRWLFERA